jgi:hypothetical protein
MAAPHWITKLQTRWQVKTAWQVVIILVVFACTGFTVMFIKPVITSWLFHEGHPAWFSVLYWVMILPIYNLFLLLYGFIFGQFDFFWAFEKRFFSRLVKRKKEQQ